MGLCCSPKHNLRCLTHTNALGAPGIGVGCSQKPGHIKCPAQRTQRRSRGGENAPLRARKCSSPGGAVPSCPHRADPCARQHRGTRASSSRCPCPGGTTASAQPLPPALGALHSSYLMSSPLRNRILSPALRAAFSAGLPEGQRGLSCSTSGWDGGPGTPRAGQPLHPARLGGLGAFSQLGAAASPHWEHWSHFGMVAGHVSHFSQQGVDKAKPNCTKDASLFHWQSCPAEPWESPFCSFLANST